MNFPNIADAIRGPYDEHLFKTDVGEAECRQYAHDHDPPATWEAAAVTHPFCRDEWHKRGVCPLPLTFSPEASRETPESGVETTPRNLPGF